MGSVKVCVVGWYKGKHLNLGDEAFKPSFQKLWKSYTFTFENRIPENINDYDLCWFGGGSFFDQPLPNPKKIEIKIPIALIGVGLKDISPANKTVYEKAKVIVVRDSDSHKRHPQSILAPDIVFSLEDPIYKKKESSKKITVILSDFISPGTDSVGYKYASYEWFLTEFASACDTLIERGYFLDFVPMCFGTFDDRRVAGSVISRMKNKDKPNWCLENLTLESLREKISTSDLIITQRLHGAIFSAMAEVPYINIRFHDKMLSLNQDIGWVGHLDYYGFNKSVLFDLIDKVQDVTSIRKYLTKTKLELSCMQAIVEKSFFP